MEKKSEPLYVFLYRKKKVYNVNYKRIYLDFIKDTSLIYSQDKYQLKQEVVNKLKSSFSYKELYEINQKISNKIDYTLQGKKIRALNTYDKAYISHILSYQQKHQLSNKDISIKFKLSKNTITRWKKHFSN